MGLLLTAAATMALPFHAGAGASGFLTAATSYVVDISNPLNRARSMAPLFTAFSAGAALGAGLLFPATPPRSCR